LTALAGRGLIIRLRRSNLLLLGLSAWLALLLVTHRGQMSPYTYAPQASGTNGVPVTRAAAPDALTVIPVTRFFYDGAIPQFATAHNLRLPLHSFAVSVIAAFVRPYHLANEITNFLFLVILAAVALRLGERLGLSGGSLFLGLATVFALPPIVGYIGQPMHYIVGPVVNFLVALAVLAAGKERLRNPIFSGALTAILCINYDWYVFAAALALYVIFVIRLPNVRAVLIFVCLSMLPAVAWAEFLRILSASTISTTVARTFLASVTAGWLEFLMDPAARPLLPLTVSSIGLHIGLNEIGALIHWPLLVCCIVALWLNRRAEPDSKTAFQGGTFLFLLVVFFLVEQLISAAFDWENNPRRALPVFLAFACSYCWAIDAYGAKKWWRAAFLSLFVLTTFFAFSDVILDTPAGVSSYMGEFIRAEPKALLAFQRGTITIAPELEPNHRVFRQTFPRVRVSALTPAWLGANAFAAFMLVLLFALLARVKLIPANAPYVCAGVILASAIRFAV
jgi:hypothetical protein